MRLGFKFCNTVVLAGYQETRFEADAVPRNTLVSTVQPDKKKACAEKTSNSWTCSATSAPKQRVPHDHPLRPLRVMTDEALRELQPRFNKLYAKRGDRRSRQRSCCERSCCKPCTRWMNAGIKELTKIRVSFPLPRIKDSISAIAIRPSARITGEVLYRSGPRFLMS